MPVVYPRNRHWPDAISSYELLELIRNSPAANTRLDDIAVVVDYQEKGMREVVNASYDAELRLIVLQLP